MARLASDRRVTCERAVRRIELGEGRSAGSPSDRGAPLPPDGPIPEQLSATGGVNPAANQRRCAHPSGCITLLSRFNPGPNCFAHTDPDQRLLQLAAVADYGLEVAKIRDENNGDWCRRCGLAKGPLPPGDVCSICIKIEERCA